MSSMTPDLDSSVVTFLSRDRIPLAGLPHEIDEDGKEIYVKAKVLTRSC